MGYTITVLQTGRLEVRCAPGDIVHMTFHPDDNSWTVDEDSERRVFRNRGEALDCAREIGRDPDLPPGEVDPIVWTKIRPFLDGVTG
jgi:hypothetical protein